MWTARETSITPSLEVKRVVDWNAPVFKLLRDIPWNRMSFEDARTSITRIFEAGLASPVDVRPDGQSLLEVNNVHNVHGFSCSDNILAIVDFPLAQWRDSTKAIGILGTSWSRSEYCKVSFKLMSIY